MKVYVTKTMLTSECRITDHSSWTMPLRKSLLSTMLAILLSLSCYKQRAKQASSYTGRLTHSTAVLVAVVLVVVLEVSE